MEGQWKQVFIVIFLKKCQESENIGPSSPNIDTHPDINNNASPNMPDIENYGSPDIDNDGTPDNWSKYAFKFISFKFNHNGFEGSFFGSRW